MPTLLHIPAAVELARAPDAGRAVAPVGVEVRDAVARPAQPNLVRLLLRVPRPAVLARVGERLRDRLAGGTTRGRMELRRVLLSGRRHDPGVKVCNESRAKVFRSTGLVGYSDTACSDSWLE